MTEFVGKSLVHTPYIPYDPQVGLYVNLFGYATPWEFTGWKDERISSKRTAHLHAGLNPSQIYRIWGPDALRLLSEHCINSFASFEVGTSRHAVMCNDDGLIMAHGVLIRLGDEEFMTFWLTPWIDFLAASGEYDVKGEHLTGKMFLFQLAGPTTLDILEAATGENLRDIRFLRQRKSTIAGATVNLLRLGMSGTLAYEVHGQIEHAHAVYNALVKAGEPFGLRRLGWGHYTNHTEGGFPQGHHDFLHPWFEHPQLAAHLRQFMGAPPTLTGSAGQDFRLRYRTPGEVGWAHLIKFNHEFQGRAALEREAANPNRRTMVTLVWNLDDIVDIYRSQFEPGEEYKFMELVQEPLFTKASGAVNNDLVLKAGKTIGITAGRSYSYHYREMISLCTIDIDESQIGNEVIVLWGEPGTRQKEIRATVARFPYYNESRNENVDVKALLKSAGARQ